MQPTNQLTLGNYLGALKNWVKLQQTHECLYLIVDLHTITTQKGREDAKKIKDNTFRFLATYIAAGLDPQQSTFIVQSHVHEHAELAWVLNCFSYMGELGRMTQYKEKSAKQGANIAVGLFTYPVLMAADILLYQAHLVPVGEDQKQHIELTRDVAMRMNNLYGNDLFVVPDPFIPKIAARVMDLQNPTQKMSKSEQAENGTIFLDDPEDKIVSKIKRAVTDSGTEITYDENKPGVRNLIEIQSSITGKDPQSIVESYRGKMYGHLKVETAEIVAAELRPIREKVDQLLKDQTYLEGVLREGAERATEKASRTLKEVYKRIGIG